MVPASVSARRLAFAVLLAMGSYTSAAVADPSAGHALAEKFANPSSPPTAAESDARRKAEEADMLKRAREEAAALEADQRRAADAEAAAMEARRQHALEQEREAEAQRLAEKLKRAEDARRAKAAETRPLPSPEPQRTAEPPAMALGKSTVEPGIETADRRVTILIVMQPGKKGIRRFNKTADPVLCQSDRCFISTGTASAARTLPMAKALGAGNTFGQRAGACRQKLACVFRAVPLDAHAPTIQPVDLKVLVHDRREARTVTGDVSCRVEAGTLSCGRTVVAPGYKAWIIPERVAERAGPAALDAALSKGLVAAPLREAALRN